MTTIVRNSPNEVTVDSIITGGAPFDAFFGLDATSSGPASISGSDITQHYQGTFCITSLAGCGGTNYLSGSFTDEVLGAGASLTLSAAQPPDTVTFTSSVIPPSDLSLPVALSFAFSNVTPALSISGDGSIASFTASSSGDASASIVSTPEPTSLALMGVGWFGLRLLGRRGKQRIDRTVRRSS
jgi:hypothetical protein